MKRALVLLVLVSGCSFPEITAVVPEDGTVDSSVTDSSTSDVETDSAADTELDAEVDSTIDSGVEEDAADSATVDAQDSTVGPDSALDSMADSGKADSATDAPADSPADSDAATCPPGSINPGNPCDCDGDGDNKKGACGGLDCDDNDPHANHNISTYQTYTPTAVTKGDWNCNNMVEKQYDENVSCSALLDLGACAGKKGFTTAPACGASATFVTCKSNGVSCMTNTTTTDTQGCK